MKWLLLLLFVSCAHHAPVITERRSENPKICVFGDSGTNWPVQKAVAEALLKENCDSLHVVGDVIYRDGIENADDPQFEEKFFQHYRSILKSGKKPTIKLVMGNHDYNGSITAWTELARRHPEIVFPHRYFLNRIGDVCLVHYDSNLYRLFLQYPRGMSQSQWLYQLKEKELKDCRVKIALAHHPLLSRGKHHGNARGLVKYALEQEIIGSFDWYIAGHDHLLSDEGEVRGTRLIISGAAGKPDRGEKAGYVVWQDGTITFRTVDVPGYEALR